MINISHTLFQTHLLFKNNNMNVVDYSGVSLNAQFACGGKIP